MFCFVFLSPFLWIHATTWNVILPKNVTNKYYLVLTVHFLRSSSHQGVPGPGQYHIRSQFEKPVKSSGNLPNLTCSFLSQTEVQCKQNQAQFTEKSFSALCTGLWVHFQVKQVVLCKAGSFSITAFTHQGLFQFLCFCFHLPIALIQCPHTFSSRLQNYSDVSLKSMRPAAVVWNHFAHSTRGSTVFCDEFIDTKMKENVMTFNN